MKGNIKHLPTKYLESFALAEWKQRIRQGKRLSTMLIEGAKDYVVSRLRVNSLIFVAIHKVRKLAKGNDS